jgi:PAS domain S-box-containing protein
MHETLGAAHRSMQLMRATAETTQSALSARAAAMASRAYWAEALRQSRRSVSALIESAPVGITVIDRRGRRVDANAAFCALTGRTREELVGAAAGRLFEVEQQEVLVSADPAPLAPRAADAREYTLFTKDGTRLTILAWGSWVTDLDGQALRLVFVIDITARKRAEEALQASEEQFRLLADNATDMISRHSPEGVYLYVSPACRPLLGYAPADLLGRSAGELAHPEDLPALLAFHQALPDRSDASTVTYRMRREDGTYVWVETRSHTVRDAQTGAALEFQCASRDVTARRQAEDALRQANAELERATQAKSAFLATMSHEMRTPLNGVIGLISLLQGTPLTPRQREYVSALQASGDALLGLISDILDFSKIEAGQLSLERQPLDLRQLVHEVAALFAAQARTKGLDLHAQVDAAVPRLLTGDPVRLRQVLLNLAGNALKFTEQGEVGVGVTLVEESVEEALLRVVVRDTGIGIAPAMQEALFAPFVQADTSTTRRYGGTGLGLAIAKRLVELMGGEIGVESTPGVGSTFWLTLRLARGVAADATPAARTASGPAEAGPRGRVLVAEDNAINRLVAVGLLESLGYVVETAETGRQAAEAVRTHHYDLVLMDLHMPDLNGFEATAAIRQQEKAVGQGRRLPIVALTADAMMGDADKSRAAGLDDHLTKPLTRERLAAVVERWISAR